MKTNTEKTSVILDAFLQANGNAVSGDTMARALGVSRVSVWGRLQQLRREGFEFKAATRVGYKLSSTPKVAHAGLLAAWQRSLAARDATPAATMPAHVLAEVDSTNDEAGRRLGAGEKTPFAIVASAQTNGRGRRGRAWQSADGGNLYMSFAFRPLFPPDNMQGITLAIGLALCETLAGHCKIPMQVKWPNDLMCDGRKIAGMLAEARMDADLVRDIVFGVGLNVNGSLEKLPEELRARAGTLAASAGHDFDINEIAALCVTTVGTAFERFMREGRCADFDTHWGRFDFLRGKTVTASGGGREVTGTVLGLDTSGALRVRDGAGVEHALNAGEVTLSKENPGI
ncbi:MAG: biotin--[acetyl-CoA-carboxylase] ligase [Puniceicoccales bacterium]|jgi:BirA family biotin operon repressor/biotin-[acetyl-CoA-carboxylase] ligase|nr:biotin--[acetyl-CoA-carboxylase] ligase [Puniceicoccales bacterium]